MFPYIVLLAERYLEQRQMFIVEHLGTISVLISYEKQKKMANAIFFTLIRLSIFSVAIPNQSFYDLALHRMFVLLFKHVPNQ